MTRVFICSPYTADTPEGIAANVQRARDFCRMAVTMGVRPFAPHLFYTQFLDDGHPVERAAGMKMGVRDLCACDELWCFGPASDGMQKELNTAAVAQIPIRYFDADGTPI